MVPLRKITLEYDKEARKLFFDLEQRYIPRCHYDENYYALISALTTFEQKAIEFTIGVEYFDKQVYLALTEATSLKIVITHNIDYETAVMLADEFIDLFNVSHLSVIKAMIDSQLIQQTDEVIDSLLAKKIAVTRNF